MTKLTVKELANIIKKFREQNQQEPQGIQNTPRDEVRARQLLQELIVVYDTAYNERKEKWFSEHPGKKLFEPSREEIVKDMSLEEWFYYFVNRIAMTPHQRYYAALEIGDTQEEAEAEMNKTLLGILNDYRDYQDYDKVLNIWTEGK